MDGEEERKSKHHRRSFVSYAFARSTSEKAEKTIAESKRENFERSFVRSRRIYERQGRGIPRRRQTDANLQAEKNGSGELLTLLAGGNNVERRPADFGDGEEDDKEDDDDLKGEKTECED
ncbi:unnamed protein product [Oikopleura dioica]|uniref:Uncharacterized protein n=1 Tax=Oikopleura dioica TaxID=34765 RepID=E4YC01_OIKDI|nr:unnamed protein product [Oikopleura dioica]